MKPACERFQVRWILVGAAMVAFAAAGVGIAFLLTSTRAQPSQAHEFPLLAVERTNPSQTDGRSLLIDKQTEPRPAHEQRTLCGKALDEWISDLRSTSRSKRSEAAWALAYFGPEAKAAVPDLIEIIRIDKDDPLQLNSVEALGRIGPDAAPAVPVLINRLLKQGCNLGHQGVIIERVVGNPKYALARIRAPARLLRQLGIRLNRPKPTVGCPWRKSRRQRRLRAIPGLVDNLPRGEVILYVDEADVHLNPKIGPDWMLCGLVRARRSRWNLWRHIRCGNVAVRSDPSARVPLSQRGAADGHRDGPAREYDQALKPAHRGHARD